MRAVPLCGVPGGFLGASSSTRSLVPHREITKPLVPIGKATTLLVEVLGLLCKGMVSVWGLCSCRPLPPGLAACSGGQVGMWGVNPSATREDGRGHPLLCLGHGGGTVKLQYPPPSLEMEGMEC